MVFFSSFRSFFSYMVHLPYIDQLQLLLYIIHITISYAVVTRSKKSSWSRKRETKEKTWTNPKQYRSDLHCALFSHTVPNHHTFNRWHGSDFFVYFITLLLCVWIQIENNYISWTRRMIEETMKIFFQEKLHHIVCGGVDVCFERCKGRSTITFSIASLKDPFVGSVNASCIFSSLNWKKTFFFSVLFLFLLKIIYDYRHCVTFLTTYAHCKTRLATTIGFS